MKTADMSSAIETKLKQLITSRVATLDYDLEEENFSKADVVRLTVESYGETILSIIDGQVSLAISELASAAAENPDEDGEDGEEGEDEEGEEGDDELE